MRNVGTRVHRTAFALAVGATLAFGGAQALAAPGAIPASHCDDSICVFQCGAPGIEIYRGICICCVGGG